MNRELDKSFTFSYWHTAGEEGNDIKTGVSLECDKSNKTAIKSAITIKPSLGGRRGLTTSDKILEYRSTLLSRGRIVTIAEWEYLKDSFLIKLEKSSTNIYPYRIFEK